ncbi:MAG TPA: molybdenum cofactor guanylyltransferase [Verrucomicrobiota bacterium]|nr:hypothetical protein [Verrucomicrobiales bacterium]HRI11580.1 molybdenum cofactor guanylyltransferase [Verrucomicrobiota bacterium]
MKLPAFDGAVLAGGSSRRMGQDKATLHVGGEPLLIRQLRLLRTAGAKSLWVSVQAESPLPVNLDPTVGLLRDTVPNVGPLAGLERILNSMRSEWVVVIAVDLPALDVPFLTRLVAQCSPGCGVIPEWHEQLEPLAAVYPRAAYASVESRLRGGQLTLQDWARSGIASGWLRVWRLPEQDAQQLINWNRPGDFIES